MKKTNTFIFGIILLLSVLLVSCNKTPDETSDVSCRIAVATDIHVVADSVFTEQNIVEYCNKDKMIHISEAIFNTMADEIIESKYNILFLCGDLTEKGDKDSHKAVAAVLKKIEDAGISVFVINGNHDVMSTTNANQLSVTQAEFKEIYADYGYNQADYVLENTLSYSLPIENKYRLIAVDNIGQFLDREKTVRNEDMDESKEAWIKTMLEKANEENLTPILIYHKSFLQHWPKIAEMINTGGASTVYASVNDRIMEKGAFLGFCGHSHINDIKEYENIDGNVYCEVMTGSTCYLQSNYRDVTVLDDRFDVKIRTLTDVNTEYLNRFIPQEVKDQIEQNYVEYAKKHFSVSIRNTINRYLTKFLNKIELGNDQFENILKNDIVTALFNQPFYKKDAENGQISLEDIVSQYNVQLPETSYKNLWDVAVSVVSSLILGDENLRESDEVILAKYSAYSVFHLINLNADKFSELATEETKINFNVESLFTDGKIDMYQSNFMPTFISIIENSEARTKIKLAVSALKGDFSAIQYATGLIAEKTNGLVDDVDTYFGFYDLDVKNLIEKGICDNYLADLLTENGPNDREYELQRRINDEE